MDEVKLSKELSYLLRHAPEKAGLTLEPGGWVPLTPLLKHLNVSREQVERIVAGSDKQRFSLKGDHIRANQGHSVPVDLELSPQVPPAVLYHGTHPAVAEAIRREGLKPMARHHVHLSADEDTARTVGARRGQPIILTVRAGEMYQAGFSFYRSENGVWLVGHVPAEFIVFG
ncbi:RNA 2'-phosphotransferase [Deinococcus cavernae]|uniref:Probable RNA 2'-phosphotransferase n=1 Tax=Deinococcus cavernae TaxID=2320857 RepID=A0A418V8U6_9DEIO|nr:RNA 2'-phosphotransferase [Deinococcus cavernae]RJF72531.1 RNA 2'-phosphotransferase [Deinococcus cavernae]